MTMNSPKFEHHLPAAFLERMKRLLGAEYDAFLASYQEEPRRGLRRNPLIPHAQTSPGIDIIDFLRGHI